MKKFMQTLKVYLTPLSPIHIGCGEDFEPTNYVIKDNKLYSFEASKLGLSEPQRTRLMRILKEVDSNSLQDVQIFFSESDVIELAIENSYLTTSVSTEIANEWKNKLGKTAQIKGNGQKEFNALEIERNSYIPYSYFPYIPGSSVKGAIITAVLDNKNHQDENTYTTPNYKNKSNYNLEASKLNASLVKFYIGDIDSIDKSNEKIFSQRLKFSDFIPLSKDQELSRVMYALNIKKRMGKNKKILTGVKVRRECIQPMKYKAFYSSLTILNENHKDKIEINQLIKILNEYNFPILEKEYQILLDNKVCNNVNYIENMKVLLESGNLALIRLGRSGSEAKMYSNHELRGILVNNEQAKESNTLWIASDSTDESSVMQPFGWAIIEFSDNEEDNTLLQKWCENGKISLRSYQKNLETEQKAKEEQQAKEQALNALPKNHRKVIELKDKFNSSNEKQIDSSSALLKEVKSLIESEAINWSKEDKQFMAHHITKELITKRVELKKKNADKDLNKLLNKLVVE